MSFRVLTSRYQVWSDGWLILEDSRHPVLADASFVGPLYRVVWPNGWVGWYWKRSFTNPREYRVWDGRQAWHQPTIDYSGELLATGPYPSERPPR